MHVLALPGRTGGGSVISTRNETKVPSPATGTMRAAATWFLDQPTPPPHGSVQGFSQAFRSYLGQLSPWIEQITRTLAEDDVPAQVALTGVGKARRRLGEAERADLNGEMERVRRLARSVLALCDHYDALTGLTMCLACDTPIEGDDESLPYDYVSPSGGAAWSGRLHARCINIGRRPRH
ncbi:DUF6415 family natural product biosynthesis protein [Streptomyces sp. NBC_01352]|uniref:DUF6415 family natural product biosynthesis protein n=1 Tax=Streptomyces sp. NBC_01352 TaxID=2903834 RepID=UPI002E2FDEAD|nr:DUF6415 family natural product biosynthesis protein [Streptomyces sp. NBC_01352]